MAVPSKLIVDNDARSGLLEPLLPNAKAIPKPNGQVGRRTRGGYTLRDQLGWDLAQYDDVLVRDLASFLFSES